MDAAPADRRPLGERLLPMWRAARLWLIFAAGLAGAVLVLSLPISQRQTAVLLSVNDVATQDIAAPYALAYTSEVLTLQARQAAADAVPEVYDPPDSKIVRQQLLRLHATLDFIDSVRNDAYATPEQRLADLSAAADVRLDAAQGQAILGLPETRWDAVKLEAVAVVEQVMRNEIREGRVDEARRTLPALVNIAMPEAQAGLVVNLATAFVAPNSLYNEAASESARTLARQQVPAVIKSYAPGQMIVSRGEVVTPLHLEALSAFGLLKPPDPWRQVAIRLLLVTVLGSALALYTHRVHPAQIQGLRMAGITTAAFVLTLLVEQAMIPGRTVLPYLFPAATLPMLLAVLFGPGMGIMAAIVTGAVAGFLGTRGLELALYVTLAGTLAALVVGNADRMSSFLWAGLAAGMGAVAVVVIFRFPDPGTDALGKASLAVASILSGLLSASLGFGLLLLTGSLLGITTNLQLIELSRPDHPLLQFILRNAPGTYQHSLQVANLAEQAARAIGANALLTRVAALYHDAGKALRPAFFIENQPAGQNVHQQLDPATSAGVILSHVPGGLELARKYRLPRRIQAFIPEHHGTLEASYQYRAALEAAGGDASRVNRTDFVYPGPRPRSREAAILMIADGLEAKARAEMPEDEEAIEQLVAWVIGDRLAKGQFDRTDLTLRDIDTLRRAFASTLKGIYHPRIRYPQEEAADAAEAGGPQ